MKLHCPNILLFALPLNIFVSLSSYVHNKNNPYITARRTPIYTSRVLSECDTQSSIYDYYEDMKSVKENFDRQTSQRFQEYEERMKEQRQKRKEERDKNIEQIIKKDKMEKSLEEKVEKGCLRCGCALGGGVLPVWGLVSGLWYATWSQYVTQKALQAGIEKGMATVVTQLKEVANEFVSIKIDILKMINAETYHSAQSLTTSIYGATQKACAGNIAQTPSICVKRGLGGTPFWYSEKVLDATREGISVAKSAEKAVITAENAKSTYLFSAIGYSVLAILIIVLVMLIIYLVLRYRRKKKMTKKAQYTKLLNQ
ncbi:rifin PIR protein, putative [Plasmodium reichenowi]|uniref:Rifin PIR protein, putative n=1 Tax=Plasmodium reichenowi TaxID=5854 RepID=A0A2P9DMB4_PLARE|nr:rifin PIR protein, putative [Plasmodium reichenowi]